MSTVYTFCRRSTAVETELARRPSLGLLVAFLGTVAALAALLGGY